MSTDVQEPEASHNLLAKPLYSLENDLFALAKNWLKLEHRGRWSDSKYAIWIVMYHEADRGQMIEGAQDVLSRSNDWVLATVCLLISICEKLPD